MVFLLTNIFLLNDQIEIVCPVVGISIFSPIINKFAMSILFITGYGILYLPSLELYLKERADFSPLYIELYLFKPINF